MASQDFLAKFEKEPPFSHDGQRQAVDNIKDPCLRGSEESRSQVECRIQYEMNVWDPKTKLF